MTGISYGQLYRWKREGLIPEEWFIKQSSYTGQETFFPREQILSRIRSILDMKDSHSLDQLAVMLSPATADQPATIKLREVTELPPEFREKTAAYFGREDFTALELALILSMARACPQDPLPLLSEAFAAGIDSTDYTCVVFCAEQKNHPAFIKGSGKIIFPPQVTVTAEFHMAAIGDLVNTKYILRG